MWGDCNGNVAAKIVVNQPGAEATAASSGGGYAHCVATFNGSQYVCMTGFVPATNATVAKGDPPRSDWIFWDQHQFTYQGGY